MNDLNLFFDRLFAGLPNLLVAILLLILAFVIAGFVRTLIKRLVSRSKLDQKLSGTETSSKEMTDMLGNLGFVIVLLLFLPGILDKLGLPSITQPILGMLNGVFGYIPNILGAAIILIIGVFIAKIIKELLSGFLKRVNVDRYMEKLGMRQTGESKVNISDTLANIVYILILIPVIIAALNTLNISVITTPAVAMLNDIFLMIPRIISAIIILALGIFLAKLIADFIYSLLKGSGLSERAAAVMEDAAAYRMDLAKIISEIVRYVIIAIFLVQAFNVMQLGILNEAGSAILTYLPRVLAALLILMGAYVLGAMVKKFVVEHFPDSYFPGLVAKYAILTIGILAALTQLGIATEFLVPLFQLTIAAAALAAALAFGLGGREFAARKLDQVDARMKAREPQMKQAMDKIAEAEMKKKEEFEKNLEQAKAEYKNNQMDDTHIKVTTNFDNAVPPSDPMGTQTPPTDMPKRNDMGNNP